MVASNDTEIAWDEVEVPRPPFSAIPACERDVPVLPVEKFLDIEGDPGILEGLCFDRAGDLWFVECLHRLVYHVDMKTRQLSSFEIPKNGGGSAIKIHKDGRLFVTCVGSDIGSGIFVLSREGELLDVIADGTDRLIDDMVFASDGSIYYTDLGGTQANPTSGVYFLDAADDYKVTKTVMSGMVASNGIALTPDEKWLWVTEYGRGLIHRVELAPNRGEIGVCGSTVVYHTNGFEGPDSCCIDSAGNLYVAMCGQSRYLIFSKRCLPVAQVLMPGADVGEMNKSTHPAICPGTDELYMCAADTLKENKTYGKMALYRSKALAPAYRSYQFQ